MLGRGLVKYGLKLSLKGANLLEGYDVAFNDVFGR